MAFGILILIVLFLLAKRVCFIGVSLLNILSLLEDNSGGPFNGEIGADINLLVLEGTKTLKYFTRPVKCFLFGDKIPADNGS